MLIGEILRNRYKIIKLLVTPQPIQNLSRRRAIQTAGWTVAGISLAIIGKGCSGETTNQTPVKNQPVTQTLTFSNSLQTFPFETVTVDAQGKINNRSNREAKYFIEDLGNGVTLRNNRCRKISGELFRFI